MVDAHSIIRSKQYTRLLILAALIGVPISALAYLFLYITNKLQEIVYSSIPSHLGFDSTPMWWPIIPLVLAGLLVGICVKYLAGAGGEVPIDGFHAGGFVKPNEIFSIFLAAVASIGLGAVVGPEAPLIALGGGCAYWFIHSVKKDVPDEVGSLIAATGSFAAISSLIGSPLIGAFLMLEAAGLAGATASAVLLPGLLASGIGALIFVGLDSITGLGTFSMSIPNLPVATAPTISEFIWAIAIGLLAAFLASVIRRVNIPLKAPTLKRPLLVTPLIGLGVALLAIVFEQFSSHSGTFVLFSGESTLPELVARSSEFTVGALFFLIIMKALAYGISLVGFRGGPIFPSLFIGGAMGLLLSHAPGLTEAAGLAMGIGAMCAAMLRLPIVSVLLAELLVTTGGLNVMPLVIVAVVVSFVATERISPRTEEAAEPTPGLSKPATA